MNEFFKEHLLFIVLVIIITSLTVLIVRRFLKLFQLKYSRKLSVDETNFSFIKNSISFVIWTFGFILIIREIPQLRDLGNALFAGAGVFAAFAGFASQKALSNIVSGIFILIFRPFRVNDTLELPNGKIGIVENITLRHTVIRDYEYKRIIIPNSAISDDTLINSSIDDQRLRLHLVMGISYDSDIDLARKLIQEEALAHPLVRDYRTDEEKENGDDVVLVKVVKWSDFSIDLKAFIWVDKPDDYWMAKFELLENIKKRFDKEGVEIPFPYRTVVYKKDLNENKTLEDNQAE